MVANYYTSMMSEGTHLVDFEDFSNPCNEQQSQEVLVTPSASSTRPNHKRSKNFSEKEDEILVSAWLNIEDAKAMYKSEEGAKEIISVYGLLETIERTSKMDG
ncbi:unnamed protein product [Miscanthus lutarioriparius]|uniref:Uncharacterized protein n=1 Tax=Miscanthus lutarioriparius TaxID=422564 RepID=A0A811NFL1_9POAL|nr:unnamed protein product [Miscanthus lutarioriparius]